MHAVVKVAPVVAAIAAIGALHEPERPRLAARAATFGTSRARSEAAAAPATTPVAGCPDGQLSLDGPCILLPVPEQATRGARARLLDRQEAPSRQASGELIARLPDRPQSYASYQLPIEPARLVEGPDEPPPAGQPTAGLRIAAEPGRPALLVDLEDQRGPAEVVAVGELYGLTVATLHHLVHGGATRDDLVLYGHLDRAGASVVPGAKLGPLAVVGFVGGDHLYLEVRQVVGPLPDAAGRLGALTSAAVSVPSDPRNALLLRR